MARFLIVEARFYEHLNDMLIEARRAPSRRPATVES
jgi:6,7-dimethyl-8-ribityllumazine synthase